MQEYDIAMKLLLKNSAPLTMFELTGTVVERWLDGELPKVRKAQSLRLDLLGRTVGGQLIHIELQSSNDAAMPGRMIEYCLGVQRQFGQFPRQFVLYVGEAPMRMERALDGPELAFQYSLIDIRSLDGERLLGSDKVGDNVIAILAGLRDDKEAVHRIMERIAGLVAAERETALAQLTILAGLRQLAATVEEEVRHMPIDLDIRDHQTIGPMIIAAEQKGLQRGLEEGLERGVEKGLEKGLQAGGLAVLRRQLEKRFGPLPRSASRKLAAMPASELEDLSERVLDAKSLNELLK